MKVTILDNGRRVNLDWAPRERRKLLDTCNLLRSYGFLDASTEFRGVEVRNHLHLLPVHDLEDWFRAANAADLRPRLEGIEGKFQASLGRVEYRHAASGDWIGFFPLGEADSPEGAVAEASKAWFSLGMPRRGLLLREALANLAEYWGRRTDPPLSKEL